MPDKNISLCRIFFHVLTKKNLIDSLCLYLTNAFLIG